MILITQGEKNFEAFKNSGKHKVNFHEENIYYC